MTRAALVARGLLTPAREDELTPLRLAHVVAIPIDGASVRSALEEMEPDQVVRALRHMPPFAADEWKRIQARRAAARRAAERSRR